MFLGPSEIYPRAVRDAVTQSVSHLYSLTVTHPVGRRLGGGVELMLATLGTNCQKRTSKHRGLRRPSEKAPRATE